MTIKQSDPQTTMCNCGHAHGQPCFCGLANRKDYENTTADMGWDIGLTHNSSEGTAGITLRKRFNMNGEAFSWRDAGGAKEIAVQLRAAAAYLEDHADE